MRMSIKYYQSSLKDQGFSLTFRLPSFSSIVLQPFSSKDLPQFLQNHFLELFLLSPHSENEMFEEVSDFLLSDVSSPTPDDLVHPTNEWTDQLNEKEFAFALELYGENKPDLWENVAILNPGMTHQQVLDLVQEHFACRDSNDVKGKGLLSPGEPQENGPIPAYRKFQYEVQVLDKNEEKKVHDSNNVKGKEILPEPEPEKEKTSERKGKWSEEEKRLFLLGQHKYGLGKWKNISRHIGTRSPEQVRSYARRRQRKRSSKQDIQSLPPETNRPIANPGHLPFPRTDYVPMMEPMVWASNVPLPYLTLLRPEHGLDDVCGNFWGSVCHPSWNLRAEMGANPSSRINDQVWNSTNTLSSDSYGCLPGPSAYGNSMNPGQ